MTRPSWDAYFLSIAQTVATRATCSRKQVGAVLVRDKAILATGYNGSMPGAPHCTDAGCHLSDGHCIATVHAETNAIIQAAKHGVSTQNATAYVTIRPCFTCYKALVGAGVTRIVYAAPYGQPYPHSSSSVESVELK